MNVRPTPQADDSDRSSRPPGTPRRGWTSTETALYRYARSRVGNRELAEDLVQDAFLAALQSRDRFQGRATVRTWLLSILRHKIVDHYRRVGGASPAIEADPDRRGPTRSSTVFQRPKVCGRRRSRPGRRRSRPSRIASSGTCSTAA